MFNNKGQSLILFIIILPILLLILVLVVDVGRVFVLKQELNNINEIVLDYGLDNMDKIELIDELNNLVLLNNDDIDNIDISFLDNKIYILLEEDVKGLFSSLVDISFFSVKSSYVGYIDNDDNKRIERIDG